MICFLFFCAASGSGPRPCGLLCATLPTVSRLAQLVERKTLNLVVVGSSPTVGVLFAFSFFFSGRVRGLCSYRDPTLMSRLAQLVERETLDLVVVG